VEARDHDEDRTYEFWGYPAVPYGRYTDQLVFAQYPGRSLRHIEDVFRNGMGGFLNYPTPIIGVNPEV
jgi:hypothetical protein